VKNARANGNAAVRRRTSFQSICSRRARVHSSSALKSGWLLLGQRRELRDHHVLEGGEMDAHGHHLGELRALDLLVRDRAARGVVDQVDIAENGADLVLHGHAHAGSFEGRIGDIPVYNVAVHVTGRNFWIFEVDGSGLRRGGDVVDVHEPG